MNKLGMSAAFAAACVLSVSVFLSGCSLVAKPPAKSEHTGPGTPFDLQGFIDRAVQAGQKRIVVPPGRYRVKPRQQCHLRLRDLSPVRH